MEERTPAPPPRSSGAMVFKGCALIFGGAALAFFGCLGAMAAGSNGFLAFVTGLCFVAGVIITIVALIKKFTKVR